VDTNAEAVERNAGAGASPQIANRPLRIRCDVETQARAGVILAQGGRQYGYALHLEDGRPVFSVRISDQRLFTVKGREAIQGRGALEAVLEKDGTMRLSVDGKEVGRGKATGLIPVQPQDGLSIGEDARTAVGDYAAPHPLKGKVEHVKVVTE
jgi:arylsulfatase